MAMQTNLSKKDKMTIAIVLFAGIVFAISWFLIRPSITSIIDLNDKISQAEIKQDQYKKKIMILSSGESLYERTVKDLDESTAYYYEIMDSSEIDKMVTSYVLKSGLFAESLSISMPRGPVSELPYAYSSLASTRTNNKRDTTSNTPTPAATLTSKNTNSTVDSFLTPYTKARDAASTTEASGIQCVALTLVVTGSQKTCQAFIDDICTKPAVRITGFEWSKPDKVEKVDEETGIVTLVDPGTVRLKININLYMADIDDYNVTAEG